MSMMVTVSGMVGSGKSTAATQVKTLLQQAAVDATVLRFQSLPCFTLLRSPLRTTPRESESRAASRPSDSAEKRWAGYRRKRLTLALTLVYLTRIIAFRIYRTSWRSRRWHVLNRYFYDLFAHYRLTARSERRYAAVIHALIPVPDLAILVVASPQTIAKRRPGYSEEYLSQVADAYSGLRAHFPELVEVRTDGGESASEILERLIVPRAGGRSGTPASPSESDVRVSGERSSQ